MPIPLRCAVGQDADYNKAKGSLGSSSVQTPFKELQS